MKIFNFKRIYCLFGRHKLQTISKGAKLTKAICLHCKRFFVCYLDKEQNLIIISSWSQGWEEVSKKSEWRNYDEKM